MFADLLDVHPPYPPTIPDPDAATGPWPTVLAHAHAEAALQQLTTQAGVDLPPAVAIGYALAARTLRDTLTQHNTTTP